MRWTGIGFVRNNTVVKGLTHCDMEGIGQEVPQTECEARRRERDNGGDVRGRSTHWHTDLLAHERHITIRSYLCPCHTHTSVYTNPELLHATSALLTTSGRARTWRKNPANGTPRHVAGFRALFRDLLCIQIPAKTLPTSHLASPVYAATRLPVTNPHYLRNTSTFLFWDSLILLQSWVRLFQNPSWTRYFYYISRSMSSQFRRSSSSQKASVSSICSQAKPTQPMY